MESHEIIVLATIMENQISPDDFVYEASIINDVGKAGYREIAISLAIRSLKRKELISISEDGDINGNTFFLYQVTDKGESWLQNNVDKLSLRKHFSDKGMQPPPDDDIPF